MFCENEYGNEVEFYYLQKLQEAKKEEYKKWLIAHVHLSRLRFKGADKYKQ